MSTSLAPTRLPLRLAVHNLAVDEVQALARFAESIGLTVTKEGPAASPTFVVTNAGGKEAVLTLAGRDTPVAALVYRSPPRSAGRDPRVALIAMTVPTVHRDDDPPEAP